MDQRITGFGPVARPDAKVLILGTMPSVMSLKDGFYYGHPRNAFWRILSDVVRTPLPATRGEKEALLTGHSIALWDVLRTCVRPGSLDGDIRNPEANGFEPFFAAHPGIRGILFNGQAAQKLYEKHVGIVPEGVGIRRLPSTSPAYVLEYARKLAQWRAALEEFL